MAKRECFEKKIAAGLIIKTFTGDRKENLICEIGARKDVRHFVRLTSLLAYQTDVQCVARITTSPRNVGFTPDARVSWAGECTLEDPFGDHTFSHVMVVSAPLGFAPPSGGDQKIKVDLKISRLQRGDEESASLTITVRS